ncbi:MAG: aminomethyl-transferring glycine dehydrogenase [Nitrospina sp.]|jgi:glycine dehydrogenase subunit 1|nr:aminomethyl-transferring glycine dehydrogenase [Nitrospina sp.]|tara:strand:- start:3431 stop:4777 length:1347 start_codon:yes stop_codon:yes gene_type:complete
MRYIPHTEEDIRLMLAEIGVQNIDTLFESIPDSLKLGDNLLALPESLSESDLTKYLKQLQKNNTTVESHSIFLGAGAYRHFSPVLIDHLISRGEFATSYTPYQPEVSQGTLQAIYEFQTMICLLTGMEIANASMYDGASALAEAVMMSNRINRRMDFLVSRGVHPEYQKVIETYTKGSNFRVKEIPFDEKGRTDLSSIAENLTENTSAVVLQSPNFLGTVEEYDQLKEKLAENGTLLIVVVAEALSLGILESPGKHGADIVVGEGQSLGLPVSYGGPYVGFFATQKNYLRQMPGRLAGETLDQNGKRAYVLTLSTREQHIRRERATSNICTNQGLCALATAIFMSTLGKQGFREIAVLNLRKASYLKNRLANVQNFKIRFSSNIFNEFVLECPRPVEEVLNYLKKEGIIGGYALESYYPDLKNCMLICVTELNSRKEMDILIEKLQAL